MKYGKKPISEILRSKNTVFTFKDISLIWGDTDRSTAIAGVNYYVKTGVLYRIRRGVYAKDKNYDKLELAAKIYNPSYVSFETVLTKAGIVFQFYTQIFVASYLTREIIADKQIYSYKKIKNSVLTNQAGIERRNNYAIASAERAFLDVLYLNKDYHFDNLSSLDWDKVFEILPIYANKRMEKKVEEYQKASKSGVK
ncbi:MAG: type IV toxin-antitoxin system AbiEi family antitoxin domain-containing protein [Candidatus Omnitrophota bacterium]